MDLKVGNFYRRLHIDEFAVVKITSIRYGIIEYSYINGIFRGVSPSETKIRFTTMFESINGYNTPLWRAING